MNSCQTCFSFVCFCVCVFVLYVCWLCERLLGYYILYELCLVLSIFACSLFQTSVSVFRLEVLRCLRPSSSDFPNRSRSRPQIKALCVFLCAQATLSLSEITTCWNMCAVIFFYFFLFGPFGGNFSWRISDTDNWTAILTQLIFTRWWNWNLSSGLLFCCFWNRPVFLSSFVFIFYFFFHFILIFYAQLGFLPRPSLFPLRHSENTRRPLLASCRLETAFPDFPSQTHFLTLLCHVLLVNWKKWVPTG